MFIVLRFYEEREKEPKLIPSSYFTELFKFFLLNQNNQKLQAKTYKTYTV